jgi:N-acetylmuramoyl-L-alanine amidase
MKKKPDSDPWAMGWTIRALVLLSFVAAFTVPSGLIPIVAVATEAGGGAAPGEGPIVILLSTPIPTPTTAPEFTPTPRAPRIGIVAGHAGHDSGAVCDDGLQEVDVNLDIARRVVMRLTALGWTVDQLEEFDSRLHGYRADALLSIHADSCNVPGKSGFKLARAEGSLIPGSEDRLVDCVSRHYALQTGLEFDAHTITYDMRRYHAFYEIDPNTPAAIIETGFMLDDRQLLTERPDVVAQGIVNGLICFIDGTNP